jgi:hypothetical protein
LIFDAHLNDTTESAERLGLLAQLAVTVWLVADVVGEKSASPTLLLPPNMVES